MTGAYVTAGAAGDEDIFAGGDGRAQRSRLPCGHRARGDVIIECEDSDGGLSDGEGWRRDNGRQQSLEPLSRLGEFCRDARALRVDLGADMVRHQAHDPLAVGGGQGAAGILQTAREPIDPEPAVGVQHHFDDRRVFEEGCDSRPERGAQHARAAGKGFGPKCGCYHLEPRESAS